MQEPGRLRKTLFILNYASDEPCIKANLNKGETLHCNPTAIRQRRRLLRALWGSVPSERRCLMTVAQLAEHRVVVPKVAGSSPAGHPATLTA